MDTTTEVQTLELAEERLAVQRVRTDWTRVVVRSETVEREVQEQVDLQQATVSVTRVPVDRVVDTAPEIRTEGDVTIYPILEERLVLVRQLVLKEEIHLRRTLHTETVTVPATLRHQRGIVERFDAVTGSLLFTPHSDTAKENGHE